jgi:hypothetical protein
MGRIMGGEMLSGARPERLVVLEAAGHGSFVRPWNYVCRCLAAS